MCATTFRGTLSLHRPIHPGRPTAGRIWPKLVRCPSDRCWLADEPEQTRIARGLGEENAQTLARGRNKPDKSKAAQLKTCLLRTRRLPSAGASFLPKCLNRSPGSRSFLGLPTPFDVARDFVSQASPTFQISILAVNLRRQTVILGSIISIRLIVRTLQYCCRSKIDLLSHPSRSSCPIARLVPGLHTDAPRTLPHLGVPPT